MSALSDIRLQLDGVALAAIGGGVLAALLLVVVLAPLLRRPRKDAASETAAAAAQAAAQTVAELQAGQHRLSGALQQVAEQAARAQAETQSLVTARLDAVSERLGRSLSDSSTKAAESLGALEARLAAIDRAQANIERLSGDVLSLQDILSNKQARGAFGEIQLNDLVANALPPDAYSLQATLSNGRRVDALLKLPNPPGAVGVDAKFPLEPYEALVAATSPAEKTAAERGFRQAVRAHLQAIAERYVIAGETADGALMFLPSEAVYAELHARFPDLVREGFERRVWIVSPTTLMATLHTMRAVLKDARLREEAGDLRRALGLLAKDVERLAARAGQLQTRFGQAEKDLEAVQTSARRALARMRRLEEGHAASDPAALEADAMGTALLGEKG